MPVKRLPVAKKDEYVVISTRIPRSVIRQLDKIAEREDRTRSKLIEIAAKRYVEAEAA